ncbi:MAG: DUF2949 domain-containing protein [Spirulinaceae cyanobacterium]
MLQPTLTQQFIQFLQDDLAIPADSLSIALRHQGQPSSPNVLPMVLWQYGLVTLDQMDEMFDWLETT